MHPNAMLTEIVKTRPNLVSLGTVGRRTAITPVTGVFRGDFVHTLSVSFQIIVGAETFLSFAIGLLAMKRFVMSHHMLPKNLINLCCFYPP